MKKCTFAFFALGLLCSRCGSDEDASSAAPENDVDAARSFIRSALDGRWKEARRLVAQDSVNIGYVDALEQNYTQRLDATQQRAYREAQIRIFDTRKQGDTASVVTYANTYYKDRRDSVRVVKKGDRWVVDLQYSFEKKPLK